MASTEETRQKSISRASKEQSSTPLTKADMKACYFFPGTLFLSKSIAAKEEGGLVYDEITRSESLPSSFKTLEQRLVEAKKLRGDLPKRGIWENTWEYIMNLVCYAVGLGNIWRFPFVLYEAGGGAFLPIYWIVVAVCGIPTFFMELCLGQYSGLNGSILFGRMCPLFQGVGLVDVALL
ncbi:unnamed protein product [Cyprideis torosa]|uniref:Uncharacterized protein n=1 Tax=Cyprideis torosa TaxID=163714 RepID=A0A7R8ZLC2_9CRUS|nr:unnamed protein product [Cyprideis torosa]CAG0883325.1 unnamed protein product [Cyprideis torosa]